MEDERLSIYRASRTIKRRENSLYNALRSIYEDSIFAGEIAQLWPELPLMANLRCGLWYFSRFESSCYFKSTDGHTNNWSFNTSRLNLHVAVLAASSSSGNFQHRTTSEFSWNYIPGAGDDEESWARGLSPSLFWNHVYDLINSGPESCNQKVADIVEKDRVYRAQRGQNAPQISIKHSQLSGTFSPFYAEEVKMECGIPCIANEAKSFGNNGQIFWLGSTNLAVSATQLAANVPDVDCILNCGTESLSVSIDNPETYLHLPIMNSKLDRFSLLRNMPSALNFAKTNLRRGKRLLLCCNSGEDISICVSLAILTSLFTDEGLFDDGKSFDHTRITKLEMRKRLVFICKFAINARPSRGNLRQVFNFISGGSVGSFP